MLLNIQWEYLKGEDVDLMRNCWPYLGLKLGLLEVKFQRSRLFVYQLLIRMF